MGPSSYINKLGPNLDIDSLTFGCTSMLLFYTKFIIIIIPVHHIYYTFIIIFSIIIWTKKQFHKQIYLDKCVLPLNKRNVHVSWTPYLALCRSVREYSVDKEGKTDQIDTVHTSRTPVQQRVPNSCTCSRVLIDDDSVISVST